MNTSILDNSLIGLSILRTLEESLALAEENLQAFANDPDFAKKMAVAFGDRIDVDPLRTAWLNGDFSDFSDVKVRYAADINGAKAAFAVETNTIYVSQDFLEQASQEPALLVSVLLEEVGHSIDASLSTVDSIGDEGKIFSRLVQNIATSDTQLQQLQTVDDHSIIMLQAGQQISVEQAGTYTGTNLKTELRQDIPILLDKVKGFINTDVLQGLPLLGNQLGIANPLDKLFDGFKEQILTKLDTLPNVNPVAEAKQALLDVLHGALDILRDSNGNNVINLADIDVIEGADSVTFKLKLGQSVKTSINLDEKVGLPALGLKLNGGVTPELAFNWNLEFGVDKNTGFFVNTNGAAPELSLKLKTQLVDALGNPLSLTGNLGYLQLKAKDQGSLLQGDFTVDLKNSIATLSGVPKFVGNVDLKLGLDAGFGESSKLPKIGTDFNLNWGFSAAAGTDAKDGGVYGGSKPTISFNNVTLDIGSFFKDFADPVFGTLNDVLEPIRPVLKVALTKIPILDDLGKSLFDKDGDGNVTLLDLALLDSPDSAVLGFIKELAKVDTLTQKILGLSGSGSIPLVVGSFNLGALDVRQAGFNLSTVNLDALSPSAKTANEILSTIGSLSINGKPVNDFSSLISAATGSTTENNLPQFPILTDPKQVFKLLLGQDADFFKYTLPKLVLTVAKLDAFIPLFGPIGIQLDGNFTAVAQVAVGFDSYGIKQYADQISKGGAADSSKIFNGFYIDNSIDPNGPSGRKSGAQVDVSFNASAAVDVVLAAAGIGGGVSSNLKVGINDPNNDGKLYLDEYDPNCIFDPVSGKIFGSLNAYVKVGIGPFSVKKRFDIDEVTILDLSLGCTDAEKARIAKESVFATLLPDGTLSLNMGPTATKRFLNGVKGVDEEESFTVNYGSGTPDNATLIVGYSGFTKEYANANKIVASGGSKSDVIVISDQVFTPAELKGGNEGLNEHGDQLFGGSGNDTIQGENGDDALYGGAGNDSLDGGNDDDVLNGGEGADILDGGDGFDIASYKRGAISGIVISNNNGVLVGLQGDAIGDQFINIEEIEGTNFNDTIRGNDANNIFDGEGGDDTLEGGEGDDVLIGGPGADRLDGGSGSDWASYFNSNAAVNVNLATNVALGGDAEGDTFFSIENVAGSGYADTLIGNSANNVLDGGTGNDKIQGGEGDDLLLGQNGDDSLEGGVGNDTLDGGAGNDRLDGGSQNDLLTGGAGNDFLDGGLGSDSLKGSDGNDHLRTFDLGSTDFLDGESGLNRLSADYSDQTVDIIFTAGQTNYYTFGNGDTALNFQTLGDFYTGAGNDVIRLDGTADDGYNNTLKTNAGNDTIYSGAGEDTIDAGSGNDFIDGGAEADVIDGGDGIDTVDYSKSPNNVFVNLSTGLTGGVVSATRVYERKPTEFFSWIVGTASSTVSVIGALNFNTFDRPILQTSADKLSNIENLIGSGYIDHLVGNDKDNIINPGLGRALPYSVTTSVTTVVGTKTSTEFSGFSLISAGNVGQTSFDVVDGGAGNDLLVVDYSVGDDADGGGMIGNGGDFYRRSNVPGQSYIDQVSFRNIERFQITGTSKNDNFYGGAGDDTLYGGAGNDFLLGALYNNSADTGNDVINGGDGDDEIANSNYNDRSDNLLDRFDGGAGFDTLSANFSNQTADITFISGRSNDIVFADGAYAKNFEYLRNFISGSGNDTIIQTERLPGAFNSLIGNGFFTGAGNDTINPGLGRVIVDGGDGDDLLIVDYSLTDDATTGGLSGFGYGAGIAYQRKSANGVLLDNLIASSIERYQITGTSKDDSFTGGKGDDIFKGLAGNDTITGYGGNDQFIFTSGRPFSAADLGIDIITDFEFGKDKLVLDPLTFTAGTTFADVASDADVETSSAFIVYNNATGNLFYNQNGSGIGLGSGGQFAILSNKAALDASSFSILPGVTGSVFDSNGFISHF